MNGQQRCIYLDKGVHRYVFWFHPGREAELLSAFINLAENPDCDFTWLDAAVLSFEMDLHHRATDRAIRFEGAAGRRME